MTVLNPLTPHRIYLMRLVKQYAAPYKGVLFLGFLGMILLSLASVAPAKLIEDVVNHIFVEKNAQMLLPVTTFVVLAFFLKGAAAYGSHLAMDYVGQKVVAALQKDIFNHAIEMDLAFFHERPTGDLVSRMISDVTKLQNAVTGTLTSVVKDSLTFFFFVALMFYQDVILASIAFVTLPLAIAPLRKIGRRIRKTSSQVQENTGLLTILATQAFQGIRLIKAYCLETIEKTKMGITIERLIERQFKTTRLKSLNHPLMEFLGGVAIAAIILYGGGQVIDGTQTPGAFFSFIAALLMVYEPLKRLAQLNSNLNEQMAAAERVFSIIDQVPAVKGPVNPEKIQTALGHIAFDHVSFSYDGKKPVLQDVSLTIPSGHKVALVGPSGGGKSTLFNLILRFYDPQKGQVVLDGVPLNKLDLHDLRSHIALVSQDSILFEGTIEENIRLGCPDASHEKMIEAAQNAAAHDFIMAFPDGYHSLVGEGGARLSGGQKQRIAIARAMLKNAPILLLDEPTSALDAESESHVQIALTRLMVGRTTLTIAHRLATIKDADLIYVIDQGTLKDQGTFEDLQARSDLFRAWLQTQNVLI